LINFFLTRKTVTEYTNATTTQLINARTGSWDLEMIARLGLPAGLLAPVVPTGSDLGPLKPDVAAEVDLPETKVIAPATHDTGSAVAGTPLEPGWAYISSGTWSLVGVELDKVLINDEVAAQNFTNEGGAFGTIRFLKNVMGLWILESCRTEWSSQGLDVDYDTLLNQVEALKDSKALIFPDDQRLLNPPSMLDAVTDQLKKFGWNGSAQPATVSRAILDSLALRYASVARSIEKLTGRKVSGLHVVGGGSRNNYLNQATANATRLPVVAGPAEATVTGNVLVQAVAAGRFDSLNAARQHVRENLQTTRFEPRDSVKWESGRQRFNEIEGSYVEV